MNTDKDKYFPYKDESYKLIGIFYEISNKYGSGHKEQTYYELLKEMLERESISYKFQPRVNIYSVDTGKKVSVYTPDFVVYDAILLEIKAMVRLPRLYQDQLYKYLKLSKYEIGFLVNFGIPRITPERIIYTNDKKKWLKQ